MENQSKSDLINIIDNLPVISFWIDSNGIITGGNKRFFEDLKIDRKLINNCHYSLIFDSYRFINLFSYFINSNDSYADLEQSVFIDNIKRYFRFTFQKINNKDQSILATAVEITKEINQNIELEALKSQAENTERMALLGEMTAGIAHEISTPLSVITGHAENLNQEVFDNKYTRDNLLRRMEKILKTSYKINKIVHSLRNLSRNANRDPFEETPISMLINDSLELCQDKLKSLNINLIIDDIDPNLTLDCRPTQISQIILNLINNSKDAIEASTEEKWIRISAKDNGDKIRFTITDSGKGIPLEVRNKIMQAFYTTKKLGKGTGLGLSISKNIIKSHNGDFFIDEKNPNTTFIFDIPKGLGPSNLDNQLQ